MCMHPYKYSYKMIILPSIEIEREKGACVFKQYDPSGLVAETFIGLLLMGFVLSAFGYT